MSRRSGSAVLGAIMIGLTTISASSADVRNGAFVPASALTPAERARVDRAVTLSTQLLDEWLGARDATDLPQFRFARARWSSPVSMDLESQAAYQLVLARFDSVAATSSMQRFLGGAAWHLQSRIVEQLYDLEHQRPGHHAATLARFGGWVRWSIPALTIPRSGRDERADPALGHAADAVATLENIVGWPALAAALRQLSAAAPIADRDQAQRVLESALGVPVAWLFAAIDRDERVNYRLDGVEVTQTECDGQPCYRTTVNVSREGPDLFSDGAAADGMALDIELDFGTSVSSTLRWGGHESSNSFVVESGAAPVGVSLDPDHRIVVDDDRLDQQWRAEPASVVPPRKSLAAWIVWLQNAALTFGVLL